MPYTLFLSFYVFVYHEAVDLVVGVLSCRLHRLENECGRPERQPFLEYIFVLHQLVLVDGKDLSKGSDLISIGLDEGHGRIPNR